jgi:hypothetical protein
MVRWVCTASRVASPLFCIYIYLIIKYARVPWFGSSVGIGPRSVNFHSQSPASPVITRYANRNDASRARVPCKIVTWFDLVRHVGLVQLGTYVSRVQIKRGELANRAYVIREAHLHTYLKDTNPSSSRCLLAFSLKPLNMGEIHWRRQIGRTLRPGSKLKSSLISNAI